MFEISYNFKYQDELVTVSLQDVKIEVKLKDEFISLQSTL